MSGASWKCRNSECVRIEAARVSRHRGTRAFFFHCCCQSPWNCSEYKGNVSYDRQMCPVTLDYLSRAISIGLNQQMEEEDCEEVVQAISKVAGHLAAQ
ncbi:hypothetical protein DUZ99_16820 [Xylanibacillus composti]|nr:hypothetical protein [Xylanibacillus composti]